MATNLVPELPDPPDKKLPPVEVAEKVVEEEGFILDEETEKKCLEDLLKDARDEDRFVRDELLLVWRRLQYYWDNILDIFYDPVAREWAVPNWDELLEEGETPPRLINIYRPHGEAIVAALTVTIPGVFFHPDDADNPDDIEASKAYKSIVDLLTLHNNGSMLLIRAITKFFNQGTVFGYNYYLEDKKFGTYRVPKIEAKEVPAFEAHCPQCGEALDGGIAEQVQPEYLCESCGYQGPAEINETLEKIPQIVGYNNTPKGSVALEIFSGENVKVSMSARKQTDCGYLLLSFLQSIPLLRDIYYEKLERENDDIEQAQFESFDDFIKLPPQYYGELPDNSANVECLWLRPQQFWQLGTKEAEKVLALKKKYPDGCYCIFINGKLMDVAPENLDDHWTISDNPFGDFIYARPLGENLATVQDISANLLEIELQTAEHGIPETFVDNKVLDLESYGQGRAKPGMITGVKPRPGKSIGDAFYTTKTAILSQEIDPLRQKIDEYGQFVTGSFPSIYGGSMQGGSKTLGEYSQSRAMALQRLGTFWKVACEFWANFMARAAVEYANKLKELDRDDKFTKREGNDNFVNVWIRSTSLSGRIGRVEPESSEQLPISWAQKKDAIMQLLQTANESILSVLTHPNNAALMKRVYGLGELFIPGEDSRMRQRKEFILLSQGIEVPINPEVDNEEIHIETLKSLLEGPLGENLSPEGMNASMIHLMMHQQSVEQKAAQQATMPEPGPAPEQIPPQGA